MLALKQRRKGNKFSYQNVSRTSMESVGEIIQKYDYILYLLKTEYVHEPSFRKWWKSLFCSIFISSYFLMVIALSFER